MHRIHRMVCG